MSSLLDAEFCLFGELRCQVLVLVAELFFGAVLACGNSDPTVIDEEVASQDIFVGIPRLAKVADEFLHLVAELIYLVVPDQHDVNNAEGYRNEMCIELFLFLDRVRFPKPLLN